MDPVRTRFKSTGKRSIESAEHTDQVGTNAKSHSAARSRHEAKGGLHSSLIETVFPGTASIVFWASIAVSAILVYLALFERSAMSLLQSHLLLSVGLGILLAAFGSQATVTLGKFIMAGAGGGAVGLFLLLQHYTAPDDYIRIQLTSVDSEKYRPAFVISNQEVFGRFSQNPANSERSFYDAIIFRKDLNTSYVALVLYPTEGTAEPEMRISRDQMSNLLGRTEIVTWEYVDTEGAIVDPITSREIASLSGRFQPHGSAARPAPRLGFEFIGKAMAQVSKQKVSPVELPVLLKALESDDASTRRPARAAISRMPISVVPDLMRELHDRFDNYRVRLGIVIALTELLREDKSVAPSISDMLSTPDLELLVMAAGDPDRTVRIYATEFLYDLGDPRAVVPAVTMAAETSNQDARYNLLFLTQGGIDKLPSDEKTAVYKELRTIARGSGGDTRHLIAQLLKERQY